MELINTSFIESLKFYAKSYPEYGIFYQEERLYPDTLWNRFIGRVNKVKTHKGIYDTVLDVNRSPWKYVPIRLSEKECKERKMYSENGFAYVYPFIRITMRSGAEYIIYSSPKRLDELKELHAKLQEKEQYVPLVNLI